MRKLVLLFAPATLAAIALVACENDSGSNGGGFSFEAGLADFNAPPVNDGGTVSDATTDTTPDAPVVPAVSVTVTNSSGPKAGVQIVFHDATGAVIETKPTGVDGKAIHIGTTTATVSALLATGSRRHIVTWTGVEIGDDLQVRDEDANEDVGLFNVTLSSFEDSGASTYWVEGPCGGNSTYGTAAELPLRRGCVRAQNAVLATAQTYSSTVTGHAFKKGNPGVTDGGTASITVGDWKAPSTFGLSVTSLPVETTFGSQLLEIADSTGFSNFTGNTVGSNVTFTTATGFADAYQASVSFSDGSGSERSLVKRFAPSANLALDYAALLPAITDASLVTSDPRHPIVSWTASSTASTDGGLVQFSFSGPADANYYWTFVVAPGSTTVTAPTMPAEAEDFLPFAADSGLESWFGAPQILFVEADVLPSYALFRRQQGTLLGLTESGFSGYTLPALPADGTYKTTSWTPVGL